MSNVTKRILKWTVKTDPERIKAILEELRPTMIANVQATFPELVAIETQIKQVLDGEGVSVIDYPFYLAFGRELWSKQRAGLSGDSLAIEAQTLIQKWVARGLAQPVLEVIRTQVFNISPIGP
ncbi:MAG: hypothetical protein ABIK47_04075 [candidate division WOR-3 bacterium]